MFGVGYLDQELLAALMDENARRAAPWDAKQVMYQALVSSAIQSAEYARELGMDPNQVLISCKVSGVQDLVSVYRELARRCDYPLHLGLTEAGMGTKGTVASTAALSLLLPSSPPHPTRARAPATAAAIAALAIAFLIRTFPPRTKTITVTGVVSRSGVRWFSPHPLGAVAGGAVEPRTMSSTGSGVTPCGGAGSWAISRISAAPAAAPRPGLSWRTVVSGGFM